MIAPRDFAVWLVPAPDQREQIEACMDLLQARHGGLPFPAHMTLCAGKFWMREELVSRFRYAMARETSIEVAVQGVGTSDKFFQTLFLQLEQSEELSWYHERVRQRLDSRSRYVFNPHLSLLYKETSAKQRASLAPEVTLPLKRLRFTETWLVIPGNMQKGWADIKAWNTLETMTLPDSTEVADA